MTPKPILTTAIFALLLSGISGLSSPSCAAEDAASAPKGAAKGGKDKHFGEEMLARNAGRRSEEKLAEYAATYSTAEQWRARAAAIRVGILRGAGLDPLPARCPLNAVIRGRQERDGYTIENVAFESLPGFYVTGNLYRPRGREGNIPAILNPHGHFSEAPYSGRTRRDMQARCVQFARMGAVAFAYDMVGRGESSQMEHDDPLALTLQLWNGVRAIDFLLTLPEVDPARIGVTGASGGGTQSFLLTAVDERIAASAPVAMVSAHFPGGVQVRERHADPREPGDEQRGDRGLRGAASADDRLAGDRLDAQRPGGGVPLYLEGLPAFRRGEGRGERASAVRRAQLRLLQAGAGLRVLRAAFWAGADRGESAGRGRSARGDGPRAARVAAGLRRGASETGGRASGARGDQGGAGGG